jgi:lysophospholipase L1-like esterase
MDTKEQTMFPARRGILILGCVACVLSVASLARPIDAPRQTEPPASQPSSRASSPPVAQSQPAPDPTRFAGEIRAFAEYDRKNTPPTGAVLFVGSSTIRLWPTATSFPEWTVLNRGFGGSQITDVLHYFDQVVAPYDARVIVFYGGDNDIAEGRAPEQVRDAFADFVARVRRLHADVPIVFLSIKPSASRWQFWPQAQRANQLVRDFCGHEPHLRYLDVATILLGKDGRPDPARYAPDELHLSAAGYAVWTKALKPVIEELRKTN